MQEFNDEIKSQEEIEMDEICEECNLPLENNVKLDGCIGKTIKFSKSTTNRKNNTILFVFTDDTFLILKNSWDDISDCVPYCLVQEEDYQNLMIVGGLISQEKVDKYNEFWQVRRDKAEKEQDFNIIKKLLAKYPDFENK